MRPPVRSRPRPPIFSIICQRASSVGCLFGPHRCHALIQILSITPKNQPSKTGDWGTRLYKIIPRPGHLLTQFPELARAPENVFEPLRFAARAVGNPGVVLLCCEQRTIRSERRRTPNLLRMLETWNFTVRKE